VSPADAVAGVMVVALVIYGLTAGADFGGGILDIVARGDRTREQRAAIEQAIAPIWEANHVWLILVLVLLFVAFPAAFAAISTWLFVPILLLVVGIVLRGAAFTFRTYDLRTDAVQRRWGRIFSASSVLAPIMLGVIVGALARGDAVPADRGWFSWVSPFPLVTGGFAVALFAFLAAVYLTVETEGLLRDDFRRRALWAGAAVFVLAVATAALSAREAPLVFSGLVGRWFSAPLQGATALAAITALGALYARWFRLARLAAGAQVSLIVLGWAASQYPWLLVPDHTIASAAAPRVTLLLLLGAVGLGTIFLVPALWMLFRVFKGGRAHPGDAAATAQGSRGNR
jgi:cytochrome d ubiquinol oxidase subunit II